LEGNRRQEGRGFELFLTFIAGGTPPVRGSEETRETTEGRRQKGREFGLFLPFVGGGF